MERTLARCYLSFWECILHYHDFKGVQCTRFTWPFIQIIHLQIVRFRIKRFDSTYFNYKSGSIPRNISFWKFQKIIWNHLSKQHICSSSRFIVEVYIDHCYIKCFFRGKTLSYPIHPSGYPRSRQRSVRRWTSLSPEMLPSESRSRRAKRGPFSFPTKTWENSSRNQHTMCWVKKEMCFSENGWWIYHIPPQIRKYISILIYIYMRII